MIYLELFIAFFKIGILTFGGGYAALPLLQESIIENNAWLTFAQFTDVVTISEITPGPIALNAATFIGTQIAGITGAIVCTAGIIAPSLIISLLLSYLYYKYKGLNTIQGILSGLRPAVVAMIATAGLAILIPVIITSNTMPKSFDDINIVAIVLFAIYLVLMRKFKLRPILVILGAGAIGVIYYYLIPILF